MNAEKDHIPAEMALVLAEWDKALKARNLDALADCYADDVNVFDIGTQMIGYDQLREMWEACFPYFPNPIVAQRKEVRSFVGDDVAVLTFLSRLTGMETDHPSAQSWIRTTMCLRKMEGQWKIAHEHASFPVDCGEEKVSYIFDDPA